MPLGQLHACPPLLGLGELGVLEEMFAGLGALERGENLGRRGAEELAAQVDAADAPSASSWRRRFSRLTASALKTIAWMSKPKGAEASRSGSLSPPAERAARKRFT